MSLTKTYKSILYLFILYFEASRMVFICDACPVFSAAAGQETSLKPHSAHTV